MQFITMETILKYLFWDLSLSCLFSVFHKAWTVTLENTQPDFSLHPVLFSDSHTSAIIVLLDFLGLETDVYIKRNKIIGLSFNWYFYFLLSFVKSPCSLGAPD